MRTTGITFNEWFITYETIIREAGYTGIISKDSAEEEWEAGDDVTAAAEDFIVEMKEYGELK